MNILDRQYITVMPDGSKWTVPVRVIAEHRARYFWQKRGKFTSLEHSLYADTVPLFDGDDFEIEDWAQNNMNWDDVKDHAKMIAPASDVDYQEGWVNGEHEVRDA